MMSTLARFHVPDNLVNDDRQNGCTRRQDGKDYSAICWFPIHDWVVYLNCLIPEKNTNCPSLRPAAPRLSYAHARIDALCIASCADAFRISPSACLCLS